MHHPNPPIGEELRTKRKKAKEGLGEGEREEERRFDPARTAHSLEGAAEQQRPVHAPSITIMEPSDISTDGFSGPAQPIKE